MNSDLSTLSALRGIHPIVRILAAFPVACFTCALFTDLAYAQTANIMWADFSDWLLAAGMAGGVLAAVAGIVGWLAGRRSHTPRRGWVTIVGTLLTLLIALVNNFVHSRDAWTSVVPEGLTLSALTVLVMLVTAWLASRTNTRLVTAMSHSGVRS